MTTPKKVVTPLVPALLVRDVVETLDFYRKLGFQVTGFAPNRGRPTWAEVQRESVTLQFYADPPPGTPTTPVCSGTFYLYLGSVMDLAEEFRSEIPFSWGPEVMDYGMRELGVQDPNGYYLAFTEPT